MLTDGSGGYWGHGASWSEFLRKTKQLLEGRTPTDALHSWASAGLTELRGPLCESWSQREMLRGLGPTQVPVALGKRFTKIFIKRRGC